MPGRGQETDVDLVRAKDLLTLHSTVKLKHSNGVDSELLLARKQVQRIVDSL